MKDWKDYVTGDFPEAGVLTQGKINRLKDGPRSEGSVGHSSSYFDLSRLRSSAYFAERRRQAMRPL